MARKRTDAAGAAVARGQTLEEVLDRNFAELLQEMRVAITGVQILFAFLLTLPFSARFEDLGTFGTTVHAITLLSTATATLVLIAPVSFHRILFRQRRKQQLVAFADGALLAGLALLLLGIAAAVLGARRRPRPLAGDRLLHLHRRARIGGLVPAAAAPAPAGRRLSSWWMLHG